MSKSAKDSRITQVGNAGKGSNLAAGMQRRRGQPQEPEEEAPNADGEAAEEEAAVAADDTEGSSGASENDEAPEEQQDNQDERVAALAAKDVESQALIKRLSDRLDSIDAEEKRKADRKLRERQALHHQQLVQRLKAELAAAEQNQAMGEVAPEASSSSAAADRASVQQAAAPEAAAAAAPRHQSLPKLADVKHWTGAAADLVEWEAEVNRHIYYYTIPKDEQVKYAVARTKGPPWTWWMVEVATAGSTALSWTWAEFMTNLRAQFVSVTSAETAREQLHNLHQGRASTTEYVDSFRKLIALIKDMGAPDQLAQFMRGLQPSIATQLRIQNVKTLASAVELAVRVGGIQQQGAASAQGQSAAALHAMDQDQHPTATFEQYQQYLAAMGSSRQPYKDHGLRGSIPPSSTGSSSGAAGDWPRKPLPVVTGMSPADVKEHMKRHKCFRCHEAGHRAFHCPQKEGAKKGNE